MVDRQLPKPAELRPLMRFKKPVLDPTRRRLDAALTIADLRDIARRRTPRAPFDYTEGAAEAEISLARAREAFRDIEFHPAVLRDVENVDTSRTVLGGRVELPFGIAPTGFTRLMQTEGERAGATAAAAAGIPFSLSTTGTTSIEDVASAAPDGRNWFQLYMWKDRDRSMELVERAAAAGFDTLLVTVDVPVAGARLRDKRNGFTIPPQLTPGTIVNAIPRPAWWFNFLTTEPLAFASLSAWSGTVGDLLDTMFDPTVNYQDLAWIRDRWPGKLVVKGRAVTRRRPGAGAHRCRRDRAVQPRRATARPRTGAVPPPAPGRPGGRRRLRGAPRHRDHDRRRHRRLDRARRALHPHRPGLPLRPDGRRTSRRRPRHRHPPRRDPRTMRLLGVRTLDELEPRHVTQLLRLVPVGETAPVRVPTSG
jgi:L-lactate dehydrogenase (cytochrome)